MVRLKALPSLKKLPTLGSIGESPVAERFHEGLLQKWAPLMRSMAFSYSIPRRLEPDDIVQELSQVLWRLTQRVDPVTKPDDFRRLIKVEMRNRCVDLNRFYRAQKRIAKDGKGVQCLCCGTITKWYLGQEVVCEFCGETEAGKNLRFVDYILHDVSLAITVTRNIDGATQEDDLSSFHDHRQSEPDELLRDKEIVAMLRKFFEGKSEERLLELYLNPPKDFIELMLENGYPANPKKAPYWLLASYLGGVSEKVLRMAHAKIGLAAAQIAERPELISLLSPYNLRQIGFAAEA